METVRWIMMERERSSRKWCGVVGNAMVVDVFVG